MEDIMGTLKNLFGSGKKPETLYAKGKGDQKLFAGSRKDPEDNQITAPKDPRKKRLTIPSPSIMPRSLSESEKKNLDNYEKMLEIKRLNNETEEEKQAKYYAIQNDWNKKEAAIYNFDILGVELSRDDRSTLLAGYQASMDKNTLSPLITNYDGEIIGFIKKDNSVKKYGTPSNEVHLDITPCVSKSEREKGLEFNALQKYLSQPYTGISYYYHKDGGKLLEKIDNEHPELVEFYDANVTVADDNPKFVAGLIRNGWAIKEDVSIALDGFSIFEKKVPVVKPN